MREVRICWDIASERHVSRNRLYVESPDGLYRSSPLRDQIHSDVCITTARRKRGVTGGCCVCQGDLIHGAARGRELEKFVAVGIDQISAARNFECAGIESFRRSDRLCCAEQHVPSSTG